MERPQFYVQDGTGIRYPIGDLYGYPDSLIRARTEAAYVCGVELISNSPSTVLDYGSGRGHGLVNIQEALHPKRIISLDMHQPYLDAQRLVLTKDEFEFIQASGAPLPFDDRSIDAITFMHVLEHIRNPRPLLEDMHRILSDDGQLVIATPNRRNLVGVNPTDEHVYTEEELVHLLQSIGFDLTLFHIVPNNKAWKVHARKKWLASHLPVTGKIRNKVSPKLWDNIVLRSGISIHPLEGSDFACSGNCDETAIDILAFATKSQAV